ncbi:MAG TPA: isochorismatase family protein [Candidatus Cloacimonadota bacterium]|jgi:nicotinamidase-related amidase|nr:isochorismatase family protein [Candidatus Cloacimonadales bacterium]HPY97311.1 isochorismatase family protein [Candidatus Cloacimonadota bacterium]HQB41608.1 isochorismatase family protein [Candidatus Cloacimonadota bacterium]
MRNKAQQNNCVFIMVDIQEKFLNAITEMDTVVKKANIMNKAAELLNIPLIVTKQYPKGLGDTLNDVYLPQHRVEFEKTRFSVFTPELIDYLEAKKPAYIVLYGIEAHVCLAQSALDGKSLGYNVLYVCDAVSSRKPYDKEIAINRLANSGVEMITTEMLLFDILEDAKHPQFKDISNLIK